MNLILRSAQVLPVLALAAAALGPIPRPMLRLDQPPTRTYPQAPAGDGGANPPGCAVASTVTTNYANVSIPDAVDSTHPGVITSTIHVVSSGTAIWRVAVTTNITHTYNDDLSFYLISPAGTIVTLSSGNGGALDNLFAGTLWADNAGEINPPGPTTLAAFDDGVAEPALVPEEAMGAFAGEDPNGDWQLLIRDQQRQETGVLVSWSLDIVAQITPPTISTSLSDVTVDQPIPDNGVTVVANLPLSSPGAALGGLTLTTFITHPATGNLVIQLITPGGITITVAQNQGGSFANIFNGTVWNDKAGKLNPPGPVTDQGFVNGVVETPLVVEEALGAAYGTNASGTWQLRVRDNTPNGMSGGLVRVKLEAASYGCLAPSLYLPQVHR
jgi:subtilisin-like proprotein convertase family protein